MKNSPKKTIPDEFKGGRCLKAIQKNRNLDIQEFMIMNFLASLCDLGEEATFEEERVFKRKFLAYECRMSLSSLERKSKKLSDKGYIILTENFKESGGQDSNLYRLTRKVFDEYLASLTGNPHRLGDDPPLVTVTTPPRHSDDTIHNDSYHNILARDDLDHPYDPQEGSISRDNHQVERQIISEGVALIEGSDSRESKQEFMKEVIGDLCLENQVFLSALKGLRTKQVVLPNDPTEFRRAVTKEIDDFHPQKACRRKYVKKRSSVRQP